MENNSIRLPYKGNEKEWQFVNGSWKTNEEGDIISPADSFWSMDTHTAFYTKSAFSDFTINAKWHVLYAGGANLGLIVRAVNSRCFYMVRFSLEMNVPLPGVDLFIMASIWKGGSDGYTRMLTYRSKVGFYDPKDPLRWYDVSVRCVGPEIIAFFGDDFVCAAKDGDYMSGAVGVCCTEGIGAWKDLNVNGRPGNFTAPWKVINDKTPAMFRIAGDDSVTQRQCDSAAALLPGDEIAVSFAGDTEKKRYITRSFDYGLTWEKAVEGRRGNYVRSLDEMWSIERENRPGVIWQDMVFNFDELNMNNFWHILSRSKDGGRTWTEPEILDIPFPSGAAYEAIKGKAGSALFMYSSPPLELSDGSIIVMAFWRNSPDGAYTSDQVQCLRTTDGGRTFTRSPVDEAHWEGNEASCVQLADGSLICIIRSNYSNTCWESRSYDMGRTWGRVRPLISYFGPSFPSIIRNREGVLVLATRGIGVFTSIDDGRTWSMPTYIGGYSGSGIGASMLEMKDGRILIVNSTHGNAPDHHARTIGQFIRVDKDGTIHPALPGFADIYQGG